MNHIEFFNNLSKTEYFQYSALFECYYESIYPHHDIIDIGIDYASGMNYILLDNNIMMYITSNDDIFFRNIWNNDLEFTSFEECKQSQKNKAT